MRVGEVTAPWTKTVGDCQFRLDLLPPVQMVPIDNGLVDYGTLSIIAACVSRFGNDGGSFILGDNGAFVEIDHPHQDIIRSTS